MPLIKIRIVAYRLNLSSPLDMDSLGLSRSTQQFKFCSLGPIPSLPPLRYLRSWILRKPSLTTTGATLKNVQMKQTVSLYTTIPIIFVQYSTVAVISWGLHPLVRALLKKFSLYLHTRLDKIHLCYTNPGP